MKTLIVLAVIALFVLTIRYYLIEEKKKNCSTSSCKSDKRIENIKRAKKNLHPTRNINVDRDSRGRFCKKN